MDSKVSLDDKEYEFDHVCLCSSHESNRLIKLKGIGKKRGQVTYLQKEREISNLKVPVCAAGYISPTSENLVTIGSTYTDNDHKGITLEENLENIEKLKIITKLKVKVVDANFGFRATTPDRLPLVGKTNGIFISICHGSRGSCSAPVSAQFICDLIDKSPPVFGKKMTENCLRIGTSFSNLEIYNIIIIYIYMKNPQNCLVHGGPPVAGVYPKDVSMVTLGRFSLVRTNRAGMGPQISAQTHPDLECFPLEIRTPPSGGCEKSGIVDSFLLTVA